MLREATPLALVLSLALAGCLGAPAATDPDAPGPETVDAPRQPPAAGPAPARPAPVAPAATTAASPDAANASWHVLDAATGPEAAITAAWWTVPARALVADDFFANQETLVLEAALLAPNGSAPALSEWALFAFHEEKGELRLVHQVVATPISWTGMMGHASVNGEDAIEPPTPFLIPFLPGSVEKGDRVAFVLAARSPEPMPVRLAFRALPVDEGSDNDASEDASSFVAARGSEAPGALDAAGIGSGFQAAQYLELNAVLLLPYALVATAGPVEVVGGAEPDARPVAALRDMTTTIRSPGPGWTYASALHFGGDGVGTWRAAASVHGVEASGGGPSVRAWSVIGAGLATSVLLGMPGLSAIGEGAGEASTTFHVEGVGASAYAAELLLHSQVDLGATLEALLGVPSASRADISGGIVSPREVHVGLTPEGDLVLLHPWGSEVWRGMAPSEAS